MTPSRFGGGCIGWTFALVFWGIVLVYLYFQIPLMTLVLVPALDGLRRTASVSTPPLP